MTIIRYNPNRIAAKVGDELDRMFEGLFAPLSRQAVGTEVFPRMDIMETKDKLLVQAEAPGMSKDDIKVLVEEGVLTISGERQIKRDEEITNYIWCERSSGSFSRSFRLPEYVDVEKITADYKNGVLTVEMPKVEASKPKEIEVKVN